MNRRRRQRAVLAVGLLLVTVLAGCNDDSDDGFVQPALTASFDPSDTAAAPALVRLAEAGASGDTLTLDVVLTGPTVSTDLYSFVFDLVLEDPSMVSFVDGSEVFGNALSLGAGQSQVVEATQEGNRVIVGVSKLAGGPGSGNGLGAGDAVVVSLDFRVLAAGTSTITFDGATGTNPTDEPAALDSDGVVIAEIAFDAVTAPPGALATIIGNL